MRISRLVAKLKSFYIIFMAPPKEWHLPKKAEVLIYDACGADVMMPYLTKYNVAVFSVRSESINFPCLLRAMLKPAFWKGKPLKAYTEAFFHAVLPKVVITFIDNNPKFYEISKHFPDVKTIFIQNGTRSESGDVFFSIVKSDKYYVDYMLVHGVAIGNHYLKYIGGQAISIGSLKNNSVFKLDNPMKENVLFISQWQSITNGDGPLYIEADGTHISWHKFYEAEVMALKFLDKWCAKNNKKLQICARQKNSIDPEKDFFSSLIKVCEWQFIARLDNYSAYKLIDEAEIVVTIDSTLGYESITRGAKTAIFSCRGISISSSATNFGWPADLPNNGEFWTNDQNEVQFQRIMDYLITVNDDDWERTRQLYARELMEFDPGNTRFIALLDQLLTKSESQPHAI
jgi:surface carbohydrate biosynthesis protein